ncbi:MAG: hypothetical protein NPIRA05_02720 [Nitrospirales bacterium]|nr:MAG: hypothetical protein NPIRA05_02720 [Nitrospirales bacterium]
MVPGYVVVVVSACAKPPPNPPTNIITPNNEYSNFVIEFLNAPIIFLLID